MVLHALSSLKIVLFEFFRTFKAQVHSSTIGRGNNRPGLLRPILMFLVSEDVLHLKFLEDMAPTKESMYNLVSQTARKRQVNQKKKKRMH